jgi:hypothetical protein
VPQVRLRFVVVFAAVFLVAAWLVFSRPSGSAVPAPTPTFPPAPRVTITPPSLDELALRYPSLERLLRDPETDSVYKEFVIAYEQGGLVAAEELARRRGLLTPDNEVRVTLVVDTPASSLSAARLIDDLEALGVNVLGIYRDLIDISIVHRVGTIPVGENIVLIVVAAEHRDAAFKACRFCIDELKRITPIWKKETTPEGVVWVEEHP